jgi:hypothetical protein
MGALRRVGVVTAVLAVLAVAACEQSPDDPEELGVVAARLHTEPERESEILDEHGLTRAEFRDRVWEISEEPEAARRYTEAMEQELARRGGSAR